jgi:predicted DNA-binding protein (UPF0251 family)
MIRDVVGSVDDSSDASPAETEGRAPRCCGRRGSILGAGVSRQQSQRTRGQRLRDVQALIHCHCRQAQLSPTELQLGNRRRRIAAVGAHLAVHLVIQLGLSLADTARKLGVSTSGIAKALARAERPTVQ